MDRNTTKTTMFDDDIEFTAEYGTAVILIDRHPARIRGDRLTADEADFDRIVRQLLASEEEIDARWSGPEMDRIGAAGTVLPLPKIAGEIRRCAASRPAGPKVREVANR